jgi:hypothetical protein
LDERRLVDVELEAVEWREGRRCGARDGMDIDRGKGRRMERDRKGRHESGSELASA